MWTARTYSRRVSTLYQAKNNIWLEIAFYTPTVDDYSNVTLTLTTEGGWKLIFVIRALIFFLALFLGKLEDPEINFKNELAG